MDRVNRPCRDGSESMFNFILDNGVKVICEGTNEADAARKLPIRFQDAKWAVSERTGTTYNFK
jgi:hypothetical protein